MNTNYPNFLSTTIARWNADTFKDALTRNSSVLAWLRANGRIKVVSGGLGTRALEPIMNLGVGNAPVQNISNAFTELTFSPNNGYTVSEWGWCEKVLPIGIERLQDEMQGSETAKVNWVKAQLEHERARFFESITDELFRLEGATGANGAVASGSLRAPTIASLPCLLNRGGSSTTHPATGYGLSQQLGTAVGSSPLTIVGNIERNSAGASWWCTPVFTGSTTAVTYENLIGRIAIGDRGPKDYIDLIITNRTNFNKIKTLAQANQRHGEGTLAQLGFKTATVDGVEVIHDESVPASPSGGSTVGQLFGLNSNYWNLQCNTMKPTIEDVPFANVTLQTKGMRWVIALTASHLGRVNVRDEAFGAV